MFININRNFILMRTELKCTGLKSWQLSKVTGCRLNNQTSIHGRSRGFYLCYCACSGPSSAMVKNTWSFTSFSPCLHGVIFNTETTSTISVMSDTGTIKISR